MTARMLDGKVLAQKVRDEVRADVARFVSEFGRPPGLDVVLVGDDQASVVYTRYDGRALELWRLDLASGREQPLTAIQRPFVGVRIALGLRERSKRRFGAPACEVIG